MTSEFDARVRHWTGELIAALDGLYPDRSTEIADRLIDAARIAHAARPRPLRMLDRERSASPHWYQESTRVGYIAYADRFGGDLDGVRRRIPYLTELGVDVLHLLGLFTPRSGDNDGGFAIRDYVRPDPRLGNEQSLGQLTAALRRNRISLCADFVLNHTSDDHEWAHAARAGSDYHRSLYRTFPDRTEPDRWEATLPEVFPHLAPGNFTHDSELDAWVWTTFREFQWDLNWANPDVMVEMATTALAQANLGVDILRLDAIAFTWKRFGTDCQNQPEAHLIAQALRAVVSIAAPATILLAEAIVAPDDLVGYLGRHELERRECHLGYHNQLMVQGWSMLASQRADLARVALDRLPAPPAESTWLTYVRCHDDIGWAIDDRDAAAVGLSGPAHRAYLAEFYRGDFFGSFARGHAFAANPETGDERTSGMAATLAGLAVSSDQDAAGDRAADHHRLAIDRLLALYAIAFGFGGVPMIYMGDELAQLDADDWVADPRRAHDSRWAHRPVFDDRLAALRHDSTTPVNAMWAGLRGFIDARRATPMLDTHATPTCVFDTGSSAVFGWIRNHPRHGSLVGLANFGALPVDVAAPTELLGEAIDMLSGDVGADAWTVAPLQVRWNVPVRAAATIPTPGVSG